MHHEAIALKRPAVIRRGALVLLCTLGTVPAVAHQATVAALIGDARCDSDAQCRTVAVGARRCGGPAAYLAWSTQRTEGAALAHAVDAAVETDPADDDARHSTCGVVADPGAYCAKPAATSGRPPDAASTSVAGQCRLRARAPGAAALVDR